MKLDDLDFQANGLCMLDAGSGGVENDCIKGFDIYARRRGLHLVGLGYLGMIMPPVWLGFEAWGARLVCGVEIAVARVAVWAFVVHWGVHCSLI